MSTSDENDTKSKTQSGNKCWLKPDQIDKMRTAIVNNSQSYLSQRNDLIIQLLADTGLRNKELCHLRVEMFDSDDGVLRLPSEIQKQYPNGRDPPPVTMTLQPDTVRNLQTFLTSRWKDSEYLFPSREEPKMTPMSVRNVVEKAALEADITPYEIPHGRGEPEDVSPHSLRHSLAYRMMDRENKDIYDVKKRLRHSALTTTDRIYSHFDRV